MKDRTRRGLDVLQAALVLGVAGDALLRATPWGLNLLLWMLLALVAALALLVRWRRGVLTSDGRLIILPLIFFAACFVWRDSRTLNLLDAVAILLALSLTVLRTCAVSLRLASIKEHMAAIGLTVFDAALGMPTILLGDVEWGEIPRARWTKYAGAVGRGLVIALPLVLIFGALLMAADAVFEGLIQSAFNINAEVLFSHVGLTILFSWMAGGILRGVIEGRDAVLANSDNAAIVALNLTDDKNQAEQSETEKKEEEKPDKPLSSMRPSLGIVEIGVALGLLDLLFLAFVTVQIRYFFGGAQLVQATTGLTYAEYARRGFFELVWVAALVLPLLLFAHWLLRKENPVHERIFRVLAGAQVALLFVIMASAFERVRLYQREYGLTEQRLYTMAFMAWLALVFLWFMWTVLRGARERFSSGALVGVFLVIGMLHVINPDDLIVRTNLSHAEIWGRGFDAAYVAGLSADAVPALAASLPALSPGGRCTVARTLLSRWPVEAQTDWRTWNRSRTKAQEIVRENFTSLRAVSCAQSEGQATQPSEVAATKQE
ncbi:MAG: DUF4173 domain-containing protein [Pyrinomonadaceae bacterium]|nr:DUF4173 domain-containing protein [Pyrinomonadaceae bacterium]